MTVMWLSRNCKKCLKTRSQLSTLFRALIVGCLALNVGFPAFGQDEQFPGEKVVHLLQEPRHRTVKIQDGLFLLDVQINPGDVSFPHTHNQAILLTYISDNDGPRYGELRSVPEYANKPLTHKVSNDGPGLLHIIALVNDSSGIRTGNADGARGLDQEPEILNPWFRAYRLRLQAGEIMDLQTHQNPSVIVQGSEGVVHVTRADGITAELARPGAWTWRDAGSAFHVRNMGDSEVIVTVNEGRKPAR